MPVTSRDRLERQFLGLWHLEPGRPEPEREHRFHAKRKWRFDFAWPAHRVAVEIHGGTYQRARTGHTTGTGHQRDCEKSNAAQLAGWTVLAYTAKDLRQRPLQIVDEVVQALKGATDADSGSGT